MVIISMMAGWNFQVQRLSVSGYQLLAWDYSGGGLLPSLPASVASWEHLVGPGVMLDGPSLVKSCKPLLTTLPFYHFPSPPQ